MRTRFTVLAVLALAFLGCEQEKVAPQRDERSVAVQPTPPPPPAPPEETPVDKIAKISSLRGALEFAIPYMSDQYNKVSDGALLLATWAAAHLRLGDVKVAKDETSFALAQKDPDEARGKRICVTGSIIQIAVTRTPFGKLNEGLIGVNYLSRLYHFVAAGSSGSLVQGNRARLCGVVTGRFDYSNSAGGTGHAIQLVGMFDIPENRQ